MSARFQWILITVLCVLSVSVSAWKIFGLGFKPAEVLPVPATRVHLDFSVNGFGSDIRIRTFLPASSERQQILEESGAPGDFQQSIQNSGENREARWNVESWQGPANARYSFLVRTRQEVFEIPEFVRRPKHLQDYARELRPEERIEVRAPEMDSLASYLGLDTLKNLRTLVEQVFLYTADSIRSTKFSGETGALTTMRLGEASCNGKSRLAVALLRNQDVPARLVGGLILDGGQKKTTHQWLEVLMGNKWVTMCPLNGYLYETPEHYLAMYRGDHAMFRRSSNVDFDYSYTIQPRMVSLPSTGDSHLLNLWSIFQKARVSTGMLGILLMIPLGALLTVLFRNMIGLNTFGTFLPALIATAFRETGLFWGLLGFVVIMGVGILIRRLMRGWRLLHTPRLTILLIFVVLSMLGITLLGIHFHIPEISQASLFPIAVLAITIERFSVVSEENGLRSGILIGIQTLIVVVFCYLGMMSVFLQTLVLAFPELLLLVLAASIYLGRWTGVRLTELWRFRHLLQGDEPL